MTTSAAPGHVPQRVPRGHILRYTFRERLVHWLAALSYIYLLLTGLAFWSPWLFWLAVVLGGAPVSRMLHPWIGLIFFAGTVQMCSGSLAPSEPHIKSGALRGLAICADTRWPDLPEVPTMAEAGYKDFVFAVDAVLMAPAKTPPANVKWLEAETLKILASPEIKDKFFQAGFFVRAKGADAAWERVSKEIGMFKDIIDKAAIKKL